MRTRQTVSHLSPRERILRVRRVFIRYPKFTELLNRIEQARVDSPTFSDPDCLLLVGSAGTGKTTLCNTVLKEHPVGSAPTQSTRPVLYTSVPKAAATNSVTGPKSLAKDLLRTLGEEVALSGRGNYYLDDWTYLLVTQLKNCRVELIMLDEFHHLVNGNKVVDFTAHWVKELVNEVKVPIVLCGLETCRVIVDVNSELDRRFTEITLDPWDYSVDSQRRSLRRFLKELDYAAPLEEWSALDSDENVYRFYQATSDVVGYILHLYRVAVESAIERQDTAVRDQDLRLAYAQMVPPRHTQFPNPFEPSARRRPLVPVGSLAQPRYPARPGAGVDLRKRPRR